MVRHMRRLATVLAGTLAAALLSLGTAGSASAAPKPPPAGVDITGTGLSAPVRMHEDTEPALVGAVIDQVNFLGRTGMPTGPKAASLGPKYTVVVLAGETPKQTYDLYPKAVGGPRVYRPAKQPDGRKTSAGWFLGRLSMSETLRTAGVPLERQFDTVSGGAGGGERVLPEDHARPGEGPRRGARRPATPAVAQRRRDADHHCRPRRDRPTDPPPHALSWRVH